MQALILAGGSGTRFWPASRRRRPKQLLALEGGESLLERTVARLSPLIAPESVWISTTAALAAAVRCQMPAVPAAQVLVEPAGRNTAAAIGWCVRSMPAELRRGVIAVLPADHRVADEAAFRAALSAASAAAETRDLVMTLGIKPHRPETGFGYLELAAPPDPLTGLAQVARFHEKPDLETAEAFVAGGRHLWNAGIFVFRGETLLSLLAVHQPELARGIEAIAAAPARLAELYGELPATSIDVALMEKLETLGTLALDCGWSDLGSWEALAEVVPADAAGNAAVGDVLAIAARDNLLFADQGTIAVFGVDGLVVVRTDDVVLVMPKARSQEVRRIVAELERRKRDELL